MTSTPGTSGGRRIRKKLATRRAIRRTALDLFTAHGFDAVTVEQITEAADVAPMTFYRHFGTKQALVLDIALTDQIARALDRLSDTLDDRASVSDRLDELLRRIDQEGLDWLWPHPGHPGHLARPRPYELQAAIRRCRRLRIQS